MSEKTIPNPTTQGNPILLCRGLFDVIAKDQRPACHGGNKSGPRIQFQRPVKRIHPSNVILTQHHQDRAAQNNRLGIVTTNSQGPAYPVHGVRNVISNLSGPCAGRALHQAPAGKNQRGRRHRVQCDRAFQQVRRNEVFLWPDQIDVRKHLQVKVLGTQVLGRFAARPFDLGLTNCRPKDAYPSQRRSVGP